MAGYKASKANLFFDDAETGLVEIDLTPKLNWEDSLRDIQKGGEISFDVDFSPCQHPLFMFTEMKNKGFAFECEDCKKEVIIYIGDK